MMRAISRMSAVLLAVAGFLSSNAAAELKGSNDAKARIDLMLNRLGGAEIWSEATTLYLEYSGWRADPAQPIDERAWRSLSTPDQKVIFEGRFSDTTYHMNEDASWLSFSERPARRFNEEEHALNLKFWNYDFYTALHNLALGDERITVRMGGDRIVRLTGPNNADWGWFEIDDTGQPIRWGAKYGEDELEYLYGPVRAFGNINFPAWGTASNGSWRFEYTTVDVSREPFHLVVEPPK